METEALVREAQAGKPESLEALARLWWGPVYAAALAATGRAADAEELAQEAFLRAFRALERLRNPSRFGPWLLRILQNARRDQLRRPPPPRLLGGGEETLPGSRREAPEEGEEVVRAWQALPEDERLVLWLKVVDGWTLRRIAALLGSSKSTVDRTFRRALERVRGEVRTR